MEVTQDRLRETISDFFTKAGLDRVVVPILQPAEPFLDCVGEDLRRRIFMTENEHGDMLCLRPEFTIPVCLAHIKAGQTLPHRYAYLGEVFRQRRAGKDSFYQAGIEDLGEQDELKADAGSLKDALDLINLIAPGLKVQILIGDHGLFDACLSQLGLAASWQRRLRHCFGNQSRLKTVLDELSSSPPPLLLPDDIAQAATHNDEPFLIELIETHMYEAGLPLHASRTPTEIAQRLREKQTLARKPLALEKRQILEDFLAIHTPLSCATETIKAFAQKTRLDLDTALTKFEARIEAISTHHLAIEMMDYNAAFGRALDYYTGFIYEIRYDEQVLVGGGRYDHLLHLLGAAISIPAVGFSLWLDRLEPVLTSSLFNQEA